MGNFITESQEQLKERWNAHIQGFYDREQELLDSLNSEEEEEEEESEEEQ